MKIKSLLSDRGNICSVVLAACRALQSLMVFHSRVVIRDTDIRLPRADRFRKGSVPDSFLPLPLSAVRPDW